MTRHAASSRRRRLEPRIREKIEAALVLERIARVNVHSFTVSGLLQKIRFIGAPTNVNWLAQVYLALAELWWEGHVDIWDDLVEFIGDHEAHRIKREKYDADEMMLFRGRWTVGFIDAIVQTCPHEGHAGKALKELLG